MKPLCLSASFSLGWKSSVVMKFSRHQQNPRGHSCFRHATHAIHMAFLPCFVYLKTQVHILLYPVTYAACQRHLPVTIQYWQSRSSLYSLELRNLILTIRCSLVQYSGYPFSFSGLLPSLQGMLSSYTKSCQ